MSGRLLDFKQYIGGSDQVITVELFPRDQRTYSYNFNRNVTGYTFSGDYQSILLDTVTYDRQTGLPNFADTSVVGYFDNYTTINAGNFDTSGATTGVVLFKIPPNRYTGAITPSARTNVVGTVVSFQWDDGSDINTHRYLILERWEPGVPPGDPQVDAQFIPFGVGAITAITDNAVANTDRANLTLVDDGTGNVVYTPVVFNNVTGLTDGQGDGATFQVLIEEDGDLRFNITRRGTNYNVNDTITILDSSVGNTGSDNITITISSAS